MIEAIEAIQQQYGVKEGLSLKGNEITEWPYDEPKPNQKELDALVAKYQANTGGWTS